MKRPVRRLRIIAVAVAILVLGGAAAVWVGVVEHWIGQQLRSLAAAHLNPTFSFDDLSYTFPRTVALRGVRLTSPDPESPTEPIAILAMDSLTLELARIPRPNQPFQAQRLDFNRPTLRLVREHVGQQPGGLLGFSDLLKDESDRTARPTGPPARISEMFQARVASIRDGRAEYDARDGSAAILLIDGIFAKLRLQPGDPGTYGVDFSLDRHPALTMALRGRLLADAKRFEIAALTSTLQLAREQDHYLPASLQKLLAERDITGQLTLTASGMFDLDDRASSHLQANIGLRGAHYAAGDYELTLDRLTAQIAAVGTTVRIEEFAIDALDGHATVAGTFELDEFLTGALTFEASDLQIGNLLRPTSELQGVPFFSGLLGFSGALRGPFSSIDQHAEGQGQLTLRQARLARLPVLATIDEALDRTAETLMKREHTGHDQLALDFSFDGDRARIAKLRMNSRWYGLRGHGDVDFDSRLDMAVDGGPIQRVENETGIVGDVLGEITETLLRARVTGTLGKPEVDIEVLRHSFRR